MRVKDLRWSNEFVNRDGFRAMYFTRLGVHCVSATRAPRGMRPSPSDVISEGFATKREARDWLVSNGFEVAS